MAATPHWPAVDGTGSFDRSHCDDTVGSRAVPTEAWRCSRRSCTLTPFARSSADLGPRAQRRRRHAVVAFDAAASPGTSRATSASAGAVCRAISATPPLSTTSDALIVPVENRGPPTSALAVSPSSCRGQRQRVADPIRNSRTSRSGAVGVSTRRRPSATAVDLALAGPTSEGRNSHVLAVGVARTELTSTLPSGSRTSDARRARRARRRPACSWSRCRSSACTSRCRARRRSRARYRLRRARAARHPGRRQRDRRRPPSRLRAAGSPRRRSAAIVELNAVSTPPLSSITFCACMPVACVDMPEPSGSIGIRSAVVGSLVAPATTSRREPSEIVPTSNSVPS